jgi:acetyl esterase/lipase
MNVHRDLVYAPGRMEMNSVDVYASTSGEKHPVVIFVHGGKYSAGDKRTSVYRKPIAFTSKGLVFVSIDYRLSPKVRYPAHVQDVAKSIAWVRKNINRYGGNPNRLYLMGHSAGAQLVALVATDGRFLAAEGLKLTCLSGVVLLDGGTYDLISTARFSEKHDMLFAAFGRDSHIWWQASPLNNVSKGKGIPPFLILYRSGRLDGWAQAQAFSNALRNAGVRTVLKPFNKTHAALNEQIGGTKDTPTKDVLEFVSNDQ